MQRSHQDIVIEPNLISAKAYEIWQSMGCPEGVADRTWFEAEKQLRASAEAQSVSTRSASSKSVSEPVSESMLKAHVPHSEPPPARVHEEHDSMTMATATATGKTKKAASGNKRNQR